MTDLEKAQKEIISMYRLAVGSIASAVEYGESLDAVKKEVFDIAKETYYEASDLLIKIDKKFQLQYNG